MCSGDYRESVDKSRIILSQRFVNIVAHILSISCRLRKANFSKERRSKKKMHFFCCTLSGCRGTQREYSSKPLKHSIIERILVIKRWI